MTTIDQNRLALAALAACTIRALGDGNPQLIIRLKAYLTHAEDLLRGDAAEHAGALETLNWVRELVDALPDSVSQPPLQSGTPMAAE